MSLSLKRKVMVVAGGSGGHIFPALGFCQELFDAHAGSVEIVFVTTKGKKVFEVIPPEFNPVFLPIKKSPLGLLRLAVSSFSYMIKINPQMVIGFGGYITVPFLILAKLFFKKTMIHEQNVVPGRANKFLSVFVDRVAVTFDKTQGYLPSRKNKIFLTRYPLRKSLLSVDRREALNFFGFDDGFFTLLVFGGSQGARRINDLFLEALKINKNLSRLQVIHITGETDFPSVCRAYQVLSVRSKVFAFLKEMNYAYGVADLVIGRSGAGAVTEITRFGLPSILIPYPYASAHQAENAKFLAQEGAGLLLDEARETPSLLDSLLDIFIDDRIRRKTMGRIASSLYARSQNQHLSDLVFQ